MYTVQSTSREGVYFLVNGWNKHHTFWVKINELKPSMLFKRPQDARANLTKLLKIMPDYKSDKFEVIYFPYVKAGGEEK